MKYALSYAAVAAGALLIAAGLNLFLIPHKLLSGGLSGVSMMIGYFTGWNIGLILFVLNIPLALLGWYRIGRLFILLSIVSVLCTMWFMTWIPVAKITEDPVLGSVFGGVLIGAGTGISLRAGGSTGGFDIIGFIITLKSHFSFGSLMSAINALIIFVEGYMIDWNLALYSMLTIFVTGKTIDILHTRHIKMTAFIVTSRKEKILDRLLQRPRGVTLIKSEGAFSHKPSDMLMTVTTRYELAELRKIIRETDPGAFVNIVETAEVLGEFRTQV